MEVQRRAGHRLVRLEGGDSLRVPTALFRRFPLTAGEGIDLDEYQARLAAAEPRLALETAVRMLEQRNRSERDIISRLTQAGYSQEAASRACARLQQQGYLDDERYARQLMARLGQKYGALRLRRELAHKGIPEELVARLVDEAQPEEQLEAAVQQARKALRGRTGERQALYRRAYGALARRGYPPPLVRQALSQVFNDLPEDDGYPSGTE